MSHWYCYILRCADGSLYSGVTTDLDRRVREHNAGAAGARYTRGRRPVALVYSECLPDRGRALRREHEVKRLDRTAKLRLLADAAGPSGAIMVQAPGVYHSPDSAAASGNRPGP